jgi:hypothetical protein
MESGLRVLALCPFLVGLEHNLIVFCKILARVLAHLLEHEFREELGGSF